MLKQQLFVIASVVLIGCASNTMSDAPRGAERTQTQVLNCANGITDCYASANKVCGSSGFDELDRALDQRLTAAGRLDEQGDTRFIYREDLRYEDSPTTLVFRCK